MSTPVPKEVLSKILAAIDARGDGAELSDLLAAFSDPPPRPTVHRWADKLVADGVVRVDTSVRPQRYFRAEAQPDNRTKDLPAKAHADGGVRAPKGGVGKSADNSRTDLGIESSPGTAPTTPSAKSPKPSNPGPDPNIRSSDHPTIRKNGLTDRTV